MCEDCSCVTPHTFYGVVYVDVVAMGVRSSLLLEMFAQVISHEQSQCSQRRHLRVAIFRARLYKNTRQMIRR